MTSQFLALLAMLMQIAANTAPRPTQATCWRFLSYLAFFAAGVAAMHEADRLIHFHQDDRVHVLFVRFAGRAGLD